MADRDPDPVPETSLWLTACKVVALLLAGQRAPAVPPPAIQAHRAVDCIGSTATSAQLRALVNDFADPLEVPPGWWADCRGARPAGTGAAGGGRVDRGGRQRSGGRGAVPGDPDVG